MFNLLGFLWLMFKAWVLFQFKPFFTIFERSAVCKLCKSDYAFFFSFFLSHLADLFWSSQLILCSFQGKLYSHRIMCFSMDGSQKCNKSS